MEGKGSNGRHRWVEKLTPKETEEQITTRKIHVRLTEKSNQGPAQSNEKKPNPLVHENPSSEEWIQGRITLK